MTSAKDDAAEGAAPRRGAAGELVRFLLFVFAVAFLFRSLLFTAFSIPSPSMLPRMMIGDHVMVAKWPYGYSRHSFPFGIAGFDGRIWATLPARGDIAVFRGPGGVDYVKRVIGLPGDSVEMRGGALVLNGRAVPRTRIADFPMPVSANSPCTGPAGVPRATDAGGLCRYIRYRETLPDGVSYDVLDQGEGPLDDIAAYRVPDGHFFMLGDNRDDSADSRVAVDAGGVGVVPVDDLIGRAAIAFFSTDGSADWLRPWTWLSAARWDRIGGTY